MTGPKKKASVLKEHALANDSKELLRLIAAEEF
jgi:hypothetical protein